MVKIIDFYEGRRNLENKIIEELKQENDYMGEILKNIISHTILPLNMLNIDEIIISSTGEIIKTRIGKKWHKGFVSQIIVEPPTGEE